MWIAGLFALGSFATSALVLGNARHVPAPLNPQWWERKRQEWRAKEAFSGVRVGGAAAERAAKVAHGLVPTAPAPKAQPPPLIARPAIVPLEGETLRDTLNFEDFAQ